MMDKFFRHLLRILVYSVSLLGIAASAMPLGDVKLVSCNEFKSSNLKLEPQPRSFAGLLRISRLGEIPCGQRIGYGYFKCSGYTLSGNDLITPKGNSLYISINKRDVRKLALCGYVDAKTVKAVVTTSWSGAISQYGYLVEFEGSEEWLGKIVSPDF